MSQSLLDREKKTKAAKNSGPQTPLLSGMEQLRAKWQGQVGNAKILWGRLTETELMDSEGHADKLARLVQERYAISRIEAEKQVDAFLRKMS